MLCERGGNVKGLCRVSFFARLKKEPDLRAHCRNPQGDFDLPLDSCLRRNDSLLSEPHWFRDRQVETSACGGPASRAGDFDLQDGEMGQMRIRLRRTAHERV
jgi:hypothetical protein